MSSTVADDLLKGQENLNASQGMLSDSVLHWIRMLASLKLTCVLLLFSMVIVFAGSLAQAQEDVWPVVGQYFRTWVAHIEIRHLFPPSMFPGLMDYDWSRLGMLQTIPFPGGWSIGTVMFINLLSAHALRFKVRASGGKLLAGIGIVLLGAAMTTFVIVVGNTQKGVESANTLLTPLQIWYVMLGLLGITAAIPLATAFLKNKSTPERIVLIASGSLIGLLFLYFVIGGEEARVNLSSMRILWQLMKGAACSMVLLFGCQLLFDKRSGIVLLHVGVALLMISELLVAMHAKENMLTLQEGQTAKFLRDIRERELAIVLQQEDGSDRVVTISQERLQQAAKAESDEGRLITLPAEALPFDLRISQFFLNSQLRSILPGEDQSATTGLGTFATPVKLDPLTGMDDGQDMSTVVLDVVDRQTGETVESLLVSQDVSEARKVPIAEQATVDGDNYQFYLRFQRNYRPYEVTLVDTSRTNYVGTATPRDYRSTILIKDTETNEEEQFTVWMNNPLRYEGETFYQTGHQELAGTEISTISVVRNTGWMLPYIACMIVTFGMFAQFWQTLSRYLARFGRSKAAAAESPADTADTTAAADTDNPFNMSGNTPAAKPQVAASTALSAEKPASSIRSLLVPALITVVCLAWLAKESRVPAPKAEAFNMYQFEQMPVAWRGRAQPIDSYARAELLKTSHKSTFTGELNQQELDAERADILEEIKEFWPNIDIDSLQEFSGQYSDWITKLAEMTSFSEDAVDARMRDAMTARMSATRWFLDSVARPELAERHRVIRIDNDGVLSLLKLSRRPGLSYSLAEVRENIKELETIHRDARQLQMAEQQARMDDVQRATIKLFDSVRRLTTMRDLFLVERSEGLIESITRAWWLLERLNDATTIMAVPTGAQNEQRSWETLVATSAIRNVAMEFEQRGISSREQLLAHVSDTLPKEIVSDALVGTYAIIAQMVQQQAEEGQETDPAAVTRRAAEGVSRINEPFLQKIMQAIAEAEPGTPPQTIADNLSDEQVRDIAAERITSTLFEIFQTLQQNEDPRLVEIRTALQSLMSDDPSAVTSQMHLVNDQLLNLAVTDLEKRAEQFLYGSEENAAFNKGTEAWINSLNAWTSQDVQAFNQATDEYQQVLASTSVSHLDTNRVELESYFNFYQPFWKAINLYIIVMVASFFGWLVWPTTLRRTGFWLMLLAFVVHTVALIVRMYISGRPPVTSLYSSAIFIGWAVVAASFVVERIIGMGIGNILGAASGASTLVIAHYLAIEEGDTMGVMQAVLDTTFWLATHVVCITLGYAATFLAGLLGLAYVVASQVRRFKGNAAHDRRGQMKLDSLGKMVYGVLCFAIFFSLVGTVLGGLWADDSWGRFWGWDPKENGAMLIVLWNAVILHARWDKLIRDYGTAVLAMVGNIVTAWSWFGVNELGAGLHSYGFTSGRLLALIVFVSVQAVIIAAAAFMRQPKSLPSGPGSTNATA